MASASGYVQTWGVLLETAVGGIFTHFRLAGRTPSARNAHLPPLLFALKTQGSAATQRPARSASLA
jgi:hypothetical protein